MTERNELRTGLDFLNAHRGMVDKEFEGRHVAIAGEGIVAVAGSREELCQTVADQGLHGSGLWFHEAGPK